MRKIVLFAATLVSLSAHAADLPMRAPAPAMYAPVPLTASWSGFYVGAHAGYGWSDFNFRNPSATANVSGLLPIGAASLVVPLERDFDARRWLGGGQVGVNGQFGAVVVGVEGDFSWTDMRGRYRSTSGPTPFGPVVVTTAEGAAAKVEWLSTVRARLGFAFDRVLVYGTGGVAFGEVHGAGDITATAPGLGSLSFAASDRRTHVGWTAGAGVEAMIMPNLSAKAEYLFADLGRQQHSAWGAVTGTPAALALIPAGTSVRAAGDFKVHVHTVKLGLNYRFNLFGL